jgi:hypothetical protein
VCVVVITHNSVGRGETWQAKIIYRSISEWQGMIGNNRRILWNRVKMPLL